MCYIVLLHRDTTAVVRQTDSVQQMIFTAGDSILLHMPASSTETPYVVVVVLVVHGSYGQGK